MPYDVLYNKGMPLVKNDLDLVKIILNNRLSMDTFKLSILSTDFRSKFLKHTQSNYIDLDEKHTTKTIEMEKENEVDMNLIQEILPHSKLYMIEQQQQKQEQVQEREIDYREVKSW